MSPLSRRVRHPDALAAIPQPRTAGHDADRSDSPAHRRFRAALTWRRLARAEADRYLDAANACPTVGARRVAEDAWESQALAEDAVRRAAWVLARQRRREARARQH